MSERDVLMKIVARDVKYDTERYGSRLAHPGHADARETIARAIKIMIADGAEYIPIVGTRRPGHCRAATQ